MTVLFKDVLRFLYERAKEKNPGLTHEQFALHHSLPRVGVTRMLSGAVVPAPKTIWKILEKEGYSLNSIIDLPEMRAEREAQLARAEDVFRENDDRSEFLRHYLEFLEWQGAREKTTAAVATKPKPPPHASPKRRRAS